MTGNATGSPPEGGLPFSREALFEGAAVPMLVFDGDGGTIVDGNPAACGFYGYTHKELCALTITDLSARTDEAALIALRHAADDGFRPVEDRHTTKGGEIRPVTLQGSTVEAAGRRLLLAIVRERSDPEETPLPPEAPAHLDTLTGLPGRTLFLDRLEQALARTHRTGEYFAVLFMDLDHFKDVNDTFGHMAGDELLRQFARRLRGFVRATDTVARFGGDEFVVLVTGLQDMTHSAMLAQKILRSFAEAFDLGNAEVRLSTSIGIAVYHPDLTDADAYVERADKALYQAKNEGRNTYRFHTDSLDEMYRSEIAIGTDLHHALDDGGLHLHYQPQVELATGRVVGLEALVRWHHERRGDVAPAEFIPVAERTNQIVPLGQWVLREACRQARCWLDADLLPDHLAVNLSPLQFRDHGLVDEVRAALDESGLPGERLELEITESVVMESMAGYQAVLARLRSVGVSFSIDDFGTGYSSLKYLRSFPTYKLKIAQEFVAGIPGDRNDVAIVRATVDLARDMGLTVIAEGAETAEQVDFLRALGCDQVQGYYFSRPLDAEAATAWLEAHR